MRSTSMRIGFLFVCYFGSMVTNRTRCKDCPRQEACRGLCR